MRDHAFYNAGCEPATGVRRGTVLVRRLLRRVLRPIFFRLADLLRQLDADLADLDRRQSELERREPVDRAARERIEHLERGLAGVCTRLDEGHRELDRRAGRLA